MAKKGKAKISKVKRNNQTTNKMKKQGKLKLQRHRTKIQKQKQPSSQPQLEYSSESEASADEWADMLDDDEQKYILQRLATQPQLLSNVPENEQKQKTKGKKRKKEDKGKVPKKQKQHSDSGAESEDISDSDVEQDSGSELEENYEKEMAERPAKRMRPLLPIKTKHGVVEQEEECEDSESEKEEEKEQPSTNEVEEDEQASESDSGMEGTAEDEPEGGEITTVQLLAARRDRLQNDKLRIGALCSSLLESPEKKLKNFFPILYLMEERLKDNTLNLHSVRKLATLSAFEVFKDILPDYQIRHQDYSNIKLKKDTLALYKFEKELLEFYKRYLQRLEKSATVLRRKKGDTRKLDQPTAELALVSLRCMCGLLAARPQFNYAANIAQSVVPYLAAGAEPRAAVTACCETVFKDDNKGEITLTIVRLINQLVKRLGERLPAAALHCLLSLRIRDVDMDAEADLQHKKKQETKHKKRIVNLSKKEKKRAKKLKEVERELLETEAQESEVARRKQLTEVTKTVFHIYFRLLKSAPGSRLLAAALDGIAKFTHVINMEYYSDLVAILSGLVRSEAVGRRERLLCVRTVLRVLAGAGDALNLDPATFHQQLYQAVLHAHAGASHEDARIIVDAVAQVCARARRVSPAVLQAFAKRLATAALQLQHHGATAYLALLQQLGQQSKAVSSLLEPDAEAGSGRFDPQLASPEHCNAHAAALHDLCALKRHYHPTTRGQARAVMGGGLLPELNKMSPTQIFDAYDGSQMAFKPAVPPPRRDAPRGKAPAAHAWAQPDLKAHCEALEAGVDLIIRNGDR